MPQPVTKPASSFLVILAFAIVYIVWGSTYYFIQRALTGFPPLMVGALRYFGASILLLLWCIVRGKKIFIKEDMKHAALVGVLLLFIGNGGVIWAEQTIPSAMAAIMVSSGPLWFVILDKNKWKDNFNNRSIITGLLIGFIGVILLFSDPLRHALSNMGSFTELNGLIILTVGVISWSAGSLYSKSHPSKGEGIVSTGWQMFFAALAFVPGILFRGELNRVKWNEIPGEAWFSVAYLIFMGSIVAYTAYVWLLQVRPATQVSTHAYVNPIVAVLLGIIMANEKITFTQILGLTIILGSVVLINLSNYIKKKSSPDKR
jgi:drug/metabolite transporter (DMT)-like permease